MNSCTVALFKASAFDKHCSCSGLGLFGGINIVAAGATPPFQGVSPTVISTDLINLRFYPPIHRVDGTGVSIHAPDSKGREFHPNCLSPCLFAAVITAATPPSIPPIIITMETKTSLAVMIEFKDCSFLELKLSPWEKKITFHLPSLLLLTCIGPIFTSQYMKFSKHHPVQPGLIASWCSLCILKVLFLGEKCFVLVTTGCHLIHAWLRADSPHTVTEQPLFVMVSEGHILKHEAVTATPSLHITFSLSFLYGPREGHPHWRVTASCNGGKLFLRPPCPADDWGQSTPCVH